MLPVTQSDIAAGETQTGGTRDSLCYLLDFEFLEECSALCEAWTMQPAPQAQICLVSGGEEEKNILSTYINMPGSDPRRRV